MGLLKSILHMVAGMGIFTYGYFNEVISSNVTTGIRWIISISVWTIFFLIIQLSEDC
jgi:hypothetical protein